MELLGSCCTFGSTFGQRPIIDGVVVTSMRVIPLCRILWCVYSKGWIDDQQLLHGYLEDKHQ